MSILFCKFYTNPNEIKILKELDRQTFKDKFQTQEDCHRFLAELKWSSGYSCNRCNSEKYLST